jgi:hypothetical protein
MILPPQESGHAPLAISDFDASRNRVYETLIVYKPMPHRFFPRRLRGLNCRPTPGRFRHTFSLIA